MRTKAQNITWSRLIFAVRSVFFFTRNDHEYKTKRNHFLPFICLHYDPRDLISRISIGGAQWWFSRLKANMLNSWFRFFVVTLSAVHICRCVTFCLRICCHFKHQMKVFFFFHVAMKEEMAKTFHAFWWRAAILAIFISSVAIIITIISVIVNK